jgi:hypothetical protein
MKSLLFQVDFQVKTSTYSVVNESFTTVVLAESYDDAANIVRRKFSVYKGFKLDAIKPKGIPEIAVNQIVNLPKRELHD